MSENQMDSTPLIIAAARVTWAAQQSPTQCWADTNLAGDKVVCRQPEATTLGLCAKHLKEIFGIEV